MSDVRYSIKLTNPHGQMWINKSRFISVIRASGKSLR